VRITCSVHAASRLVTYKLDQSPTWDEINEFFKEVQGHPDFEREFNLLGDHRRIDWVPGNADLRRFAADIWGQVEHLGHCRWAVVASTPTSLAVIRLLGLLTHGCGIEIAPFSNPREAVTWVCADSGNRRGLEAVH